MPSKESAVGCGKAVSRQPSKSNVLLESRTKQKLSSGLEHANVEFIGKLSPLCGLRLEIAGLQVEQARSHPRKVTSR